MPAIIEDYETDDPPYLHANTEEAGIVWRVLLDYRFMQDRHFQHLVVFDEKISQNRVHHRPSDDILNWLQENDPDHQNELVSKNQTVIRFTSEVPAMGFRLRFDGRVVEDDERTRMLFGLPERET